jgi:ubiquinone/menaquinone biosynthesis C-methylase UbiE
MGTLFDKNYVEYWQEKSGKLADEEVISFFIDQLGIEEKDVVLDLGCGHGRLFPIISKYTKNIIGLDVNYEAINMAVKFPYLCLVKGSAEETNIPSGFFDKVIAWAVYDVVDQRKALIEQNRILKNGGYLLITGKNSKYTKDDKNAFIAERNAKLKDFPNHFTDIKKLLLVIKEFGFSLVKNYIFPKRGDLRRAEFVDLQKKIIPCFYEYLLILKKTGTPIILPTQICDEYSETAKGFAENNNFTNIRKFFMWHKKKYGND